VGVAAAADYGWGVVADLLLQILYQSAQAARGYRKKEEQHGNSVTWTGRSPVKATGQAGGG
jgi:hypothetical protein